MPDLFGRVAKLQLGQPGELGVEITDLRISFDITKTSGSEANKAVIKVFNLNEDTRAAAEEKDTVVYLEAGYKYTAKLIYAGYITKVVHQQQGPDIVSTIESGDGIKPLREGKIKISITKGVNLKTLLIDIFKQAFDTLPTVFEGIPDKVLKRGFSANGKAKAILDKILKSYNLTWSFQDNQIVVYPEKEGYGKAIYLSSLTGLVGSPSRTDTGIQFRTLLMPELNPGRIVQIETDALSGFFRLTKVRHSGDTHGTNWYSDCEAVEL